MYKGIVGHTSSGFLTTDETTTSFARFGKCWTNSIPLWLSSARYVSKEHAAATVQVDGLAD